MDYKALASAAWKGYQEKVAEQKALINEADKMAGLTAEQDMKFDALQKEAEALEREALRYEQLAKNEEKSSNLGKQSTSSLPLPTMHDTQGGILDNGGFKSLGEFITATRFGDPQGRLIKEMVGTDQHGTNPGGFLVPPQFSAQILNLPITAPFVRNYATVIPADSATPDASLTIPAMDYSINNYGGVVTDWVADEGGTKPETTMKMTQITLTPKEIAAWIPVSDTLLRNSSAAEMLITRNMSAALMNAEQNAFLHGNGSQKPTGVFDEQNTGAIKISPTASGKVAYTDIIKMRASMTADSYANAVWNIDQTYMTDIIGMKDEAKNLIYIAGNISNTGLDMLLGRPILWSNANVGVALIDWSAYLIKDGSGIYIAASPHVRFTSNQTVIKIFRLVDGKPWVKAPLKYENGLSLSPYVVLNGLVKTPTAP